MFTCEVSHLNICSPSVKKQSHFLLYFSTFYPSPSFLHLYCFLVLSPSFPLTLFPTSSLSLLQVSIFPHDLLLSPTPLLHRLTYFSNLHCVSQLKAFSSSYRPVVSLGTIRSALALGFCNSLTSSLPFLSSLWVFFPLPPHFVSFIFSLDLSTELFALDKTWCKFASLRSDKFDRRTWKWAAELVRRSEFDESTWSKQKAARVEVVAITAWWVQLTS